MIDVNFLILVNEAPSLLGRKYMIENGLDISLLRRYITYQNLRHPLHFIKYFLVDKLKETGNPYVLHPMQ